MAMAMPNDVVKRERKTNFSDSEISCLLDNYAVHATTLQSKLSTTITNSKKKQLWDAIAREVNSRGSDQRTVAELKKKWAEMKSACLRIISARRNPKTGGGKKDKEPWYVNVILDILGEDTALVEGIASKCIC